MICVVCLVQFMYVYVLCLFMSVFVYFVPAVNACMIQIHIPRLAEKVYTVGVPFDVAQRDATLIV